MVQIGFIDNNKYWEYEELYSGIVLDNNSYQC